MLSTKATLLTVFICSLTLENQAQSLKLIYDDGIVRQIEKLDFHWTLEGETRVMMDSGVFNAKSQQWRLAKRYFQRVIKVDSLNIPAHYFLYRCHLKLHTAFTKEATLARKYVERNLSESAPIYADLWNMYFSSQHKTRQFLPSFEIAPPLALFIGYLNEHTDALDEDSFTTLKRAFGYLMAGRPKESLLVCDGAFAARKATSVLYLKAIAFDLLSRYDSSYALFKQVAQIDNAVVEAHEHLAFFGAQLGDTLDVKVHLSTLESLLPDSANRWRFNGLIAVKIRDYRFAIENLLRYISKYPNDFEALKQLAIADYGIGNYGRAFRELELANALKIYDLEIFFYMSSIYYLLEDDKRCISILENARLPHQFQPGLEIFLAEKLLDIGRPGQAQLVIDRMMPRLQPSRRTYLPQINNSFNQPIVKYRYGNTVRADRRFWVAANITQCHIFMKKDRPARAIKYLTWLIKWQGAQDPEYFFLRAQLYLDGGNVAQAKSDLEMLVRLNYGPAIELCHRRKEIGV